MGVNLEIEDSSIRQYLKDAIHQLQWLRKWGEKAMERITKNDFFKKIDTETNSIAILTKHLSGNMFARWTNFFAFSDKEPMRDRDSEFHIFDTDTRTELVHRWNTGWDCLFDILGRITEKDMKRTVTIRGKKYTVVGAINRQLAHYAYHVGQIVFLAKHFRLSDWQSLSIPKGHSDEFTKAMIDKHKTPNEK